MHIMYFEQIHPIIRSYAPPLFKWFLMDFIILFSYTRLLFFEILDPIVRHPHVYGQGL
jgi:hypothetical protein